MEPLKDMFSSIVNSTIVRIILAIGVVKHWHLYQLDVDNAFLYGELNEEVYITPPID